MGEEEVLTGSKDTNSISKIVAHDVWETKRAAGAAWVPVRARGGGHFPISKGWNYRNFADAYEFQSSELGAGDGGVP